MNRIEAWWRTLNQHWRRPWRRVNVAMQAGLRGYTGRWQQLGHRRSKASQSAPASTLRRWLAMDVNDIARRVYAWLQQDHAVTDWRQWADMDVTRWSLRQRRTLLAVWFGIVFTGAALVAWATPLAQLQGQDEETARLKARYAQVAAQSTRLPRYQQQLADFEARFGEQMHLLPASLTPVEVLALLHQAARQSGIQLQAFKPGSAVVTTHAVALPAEARLSGSYHALGRFLEAVSRLSTLLTVDVLIEAGSSANNQGTASGATNDITSDASTVLKITAYIKAYRQRAADETVPAVASVK